MIGLALSTQAAVAQFSGPAQTPPAPSIPAVRGQNVATERQTTWAIRALEPNSQEAQQVAAQAKAQSQPDEALASDGSRSKVARAGSSASDDPADGIVELAGFLGRPTMPATPQDPVPPLPAEARGGTVGTSTTHAPQPAAANVNERRLNTAIAAARTLTPDANRSRLISINPSGQLLGILVSGNIEQAFITTARGDELILLGAPGANLPVGFNSSGQVVGTMKVNGADRAYVSGANGAEPLVDLESLPVVVEGGWTLLRPTRIDDNGQITGSGLVGGKERAFVLTQFSTPN